MKLRVHAAASCLCLVAAAWLPVAGCSRGRPEQARQPETPPAVTAEMALEAQEHFGMRWAPAEMRDLKEYLQVAGTVQPAGNHVAQVRPLARGRVLEALARVGDRVRAGQPLARFDNIEAAEISARLGAARAELERLKIEAAAQARRAERSRDLVEIGAVARKEYEQHLAGKQAIEESLRAQEHVIAGLSARMARFGASESVRAPIAGVVIQADAAPGAVVGQENALFTVADLSQVWVQAEVYEKDLGRIRAGQTALVSVDTWPGTAFPGRVTYISDMLDHQTRTAKVRCELPNPGGRLKVDMFATVRLPTTFARRALAVPEDAVQELEGKKVVFLRIVPTRFQARAVHPGRTVDGYTEILDGLRAGEIVVIEGAFHVKSVLAGGGLKEE